MADFRKALQHVIENEGGYVDDPDDPGGETYKGIARRRNPKWPGWVLIDLAKLQPKFPENLDGNPELHEKISSLYRENYWDKIMGDDIFNQDVAESIFDFAVNAGPRTSIRLAQIAASAEPDGVLGPKTLQAINEIDEKLFVLIFAISKIARYIKICRKRPKSRKYFFGWVIRTLEAL